MKPRLNRFATLILSVLALTALAACGKQESTPAGSGQQAASTEVEAPKTATVEEGTPGAAGQTAGQPVNEMEGGSPAGEQTAAVRPAVQLGASGSGPATSGKFKEGTNYTRLVPAQPTSAAPGKVEVVEVFWYGCPHCFALDPALETWRSKAPGYIQFVRVPAMWNEATRMHARVFYTAELLGKLDELHTAIFREIHVNGDPLNTVSKITAFFQQHGVSAADFNKAFSSFAVESKLQRADFLNRRYRVESVPMFVVNGKYTTDVSSAGGEQQLLALIDELAAHEHGG